jgi:hypothetical protein
VLIVEFYWDDRNVQHLLERGVDPDDVDAMLVSRITVTKNKRAGSGDYRFDGVGRGGRPVTVVVASTTWPGVWRPVSARYGS